MILFAGYTSQGPAGVPQQVNSVEEFTATFGSGTYFLQQSLFLFFANGGQSAHVLSLGNGSSPSLEDFRAAIEALANGEGDLVAMPDSVLLGKDDHGALVTGVLQTCADTKRWFFLVDLRETDLGADSIRTTNGSWGAAYAPWLVTVNNLTTPPSGAIAGICASRDPWQAPSNVAPAGVRNVSQPIGGQAMTEMLHGAPPVNPIRLFAVQGPLVWGARTLDGSSPDYRYIQIRRTLIYIEQSLKGALQQFQFSPNDASTWSAAKAQVEAFLTGIWKEGGLMGANPQDAYNVEIGLGSTMTQNDLDNGRMILQAAVAPAQPAEFIAITFTQQLATSA